MNDDDKPPPRPYGVYARLNPLPNVATEVVADYKTRQNAERSKTARTP